MSYLKDLPCASCGTKSTYYFPDKPTAHYCYCEFRHEIGEQIAREIEAKCLSKKHDVEDQDVLNSPPAICDDCAEDAAIARGEK